MRKTMSRRGALATAASIIVVQDTSPPLRPAATLVPRHPDPALAAAERCHKAESLILWADRHFLRTGDDGLLNRAGKAHDALVYDLLDTPAQSIAGAIAKLEEVFGCSFIADDTPLPLEAAAVQSVFADLKRFGGGA